MAIAQIISWLLCRAPLILGKWRRSSCQERSCWCAEPNLPAPGKTEVPQWFFGITFAEHGVARVSHAPRPYLMAMKSLEEEARAAVLGVYDGNPESPPSD